MEQWYINPINQPIDKTVSMHYNNVYHKASVTEDAGNRVHTNDKAQLCQLLLQRKRRRADRKYWRHNEGQGVVGIGDRSYA